MEEISPPRLGEQGEEPASVQPPPTIVRLTPKAELATEYRSRYFARFVGFDEEDGSREARAEVKRWEDLVTQERALQERVEAERVRLVTKVRAVLRVRSLAYGPRRIQSPRTSREITGIICTIEKNRHFYL